MVNTLPGPDKGLLDVLFGGSMPETAQAVVPGVPGETAPTADDFRKMLVQAQDQPEAAQARGPGIPQGIPTAAQQSQTKGGSQQVLTGSSTPQPQPAEVSKTGERKKAEAIAQKPQKECAVEEGCETSPVPSPARQSVDARTGMPAAAVTAGVVQTVVPQSAQAKPAVPSQAGIAAKNGGAGAKAPDPAVTNAAVSGGSQRMAPGVVAADPQLASLQGAASGRAANMAPATELTALTQRQRSAPVPASKAVAAESTAPAGIPVGTVALQPIVIQMPIAVPMAVDVLDVEVDSEPLAGGMTGAISREMPHRSALSSQDFLAGRGATLGVDRPDPRLRARTGREEMTEGGSDRFGQVAPQVAGHGGLIAIGSQANPIQGERASMGVRSGLPIAGRMDLGDPVTGPMVLASQVNGLAMRGGGTIRLRMMPENLGELTISVQQGRDQKLDVRFDASSVEARDVLVNSMPELRQALASNRYDVGQIEVNSPQPRVSGRLQSFASDSGAGQWGGIALGMSDSGQANAALGGGAYGSPWHGDSRGDAHGQGQGGSAWDRYFAQQDARQQYQGGRQQSGYRRYQEAELGA